MNAPVLAVPHGCFVLVTVLGYAIAFLALSCGGSWLVIALGYGSLHGSGLDERWQAWIGSAVLLPVSCFAYVFSRTWWPRLAAKRRTSR